jgi:hypothetical protein
MKPVAHDIKKIKGSDGHRYFHTLTIFMFPNEYQHIFKVKYLTMYLSSKMSFLGLFHSLMTKEIFFP